MDIVDRDLEKAERDASPEHPPTNFLADAPRRPEQIHSPKAGSTRVERRGTTTGSSASSSSASVVREPISISRVNTQRDLDRHPTELDRIETHRTQHSTTVGRTTTSRKSKKPLPNFGGGKEYPPPLPAQEDYVVELDGPDDPMHPQNWPLRKKMFLAVILGYTTLTAAFASSIFSAATIAVARQFHVSAEVGVLGVSLYVLGFAFGQS